jgi:hypothetical protein
MVDVEADGPIPGDYSMVSIAPLAPKAIGAIIVEPALTRTFYGELRPISEKWVPESLRVCGFVGLWVLYQGYSNNSKTQHFPAT